MESHHHQEDSRSNSSSNSNLRWLIYGHSGWIGSQIIALLKQSQNHDVILTTDTRVDNVAEIRHDLETLKPDRVICLVGRTSGPGYNTIDYLEQDGKLVENIRDNLFGPLTLALLCEAKGIHLTYMGTGCIFTYDESHPVESGVGFTEQDQPNYFDSSYSVVKGFSDRLFHLMPDALNIRLRMPIINRDHPRNLISKLIRYQKICSVPNSMTVLDELLPVMLRAAREKLTGTLNLTNPGSITHNEILDLYREHVDPSFTYKNFTVEEQRKILACGRSNNLLDTNRLEQFAPEVRPIREAVIDTLKNWHKD